jgi:hypothetical protein
MRRVLIVTSAYAPTMIADMHRTRHLAWELPALGWEVEILSPSAEYQPASCVDQDSAGFFAPYSTVHHVAVRWRRLFKIAGIGTVGWRALLPLWLAGRRLLKQKHFDLVYISTAHFPLFLLGRLWRRRFKVPYILDLHDPPYQENSTHPVSPPPRLKHRISGMLARHVETKVITAAQGLIAVSRTYIDEVRRHNQANEPAWSQPGRSAIIPFSVLPLDLREAVHSSVPPGPRKGPPYRVVYVGVGGPVMARSFNVFCRALAWLRKRCPVLCDMIRIELFGTMLGWRPGEARHLAEIASNCGIERLVREEPERVSYRRSLELLLESDGALIFGVEDSGYIPSKLFSYGLSGKPLLAVVHREGPAFAQFQRMPDLGHVLWFRQHDEMPLEEAAQVLKDFLSESVRGQAFDRRTSLLPYLAPEMARRHIDVFEACV